MKVPAQSAYAPPGNANPSGESFLSGLASRGVFSNVLTMADSHKLLADYLENGSETAFRELVENYIDLVYAAAVRLVDGDTHLAEDVAQTVFLDLARMGRKLSKDVMLGGWLHRHTCFVAAKTMRGRRRRELREREAAQMSTMEDHSASNLAQATPFLDDAVDRLDAEDRTAVVLRFFEQRDFRSVGEALGSSEDAARKRVNRALEKLQGMLKRQGVTISVGALAAVLGGEAATAAPAGLAAAISGGALANTIAGGGTAPALLKIMTLTKLKIVAGAMVAGMAATVIIQSQTNGRLQKENQSLNNQLASLAQLHKDNPHPAGQQTNATEADQSQLNELIRLRGEVTRLKRELADANKLGTQNKDLVSKLQKKADSVDQAKQFAEFAESKMSYDRQWLLAFLLYAGDNQGQLPTSFDRAAAYVSNSNSPSQTNADHSMGELEIVYQGPLSAITNPANTILIRGSQPWQMPDGGWVNDYGFADGHGEIHRAVDGNFEPWEQAHMQQAPVSQ